MLLLPYDAVERRAPRFRGGEAHDEAFLALAELELPTALHFGLPELALSEDVGLRVGAVGVSLLVRAQVAQEVEGPRAVFAAGQAAGVCAGG